MVKKITLDAVITDAQDNQRLDITLAQLFPEYSRSQLQQWIKNGFVMINDQIMTKPRQTTQSQQRVKINAEQVIQTELAGESIPLNIVYEDDALIVINKPIGLIVHPGAGNPSHTLANALLHHLPELATIPRAGIIHRLDKDTSGLLVIAKTLTAHNALIKQMQAREIKREYRAIVHGVLISGDTIDAPMGRHPTKRVKMAVVKHGGKEAITHFRVLEKFHEHSLLAVHLETGRTHQIRVHMAHIRCPIVGDKTYAARAYHYPELPKELQTALYAFNHQALHAYKLSLTHPVTHQYHEWKAPLPDDFLMLVKLLRKHAENSKNSEEIW